MSDALLGVIIGGAIAILPPMFTLIFQSINENRKEKRKNKQMAYDKITRYLYHLFNWNNKISKIREINELTEEASVLATLYCDSNIQNELKEVNDIFHEYVKLVRENKSQLAKEIKEELRKKNKKIRLMITKDMGNK